MKKWGAGFSHSDRGMVGPPDLRRWIRERDDAHKDISACERKFAGRDILMRITFFIRRRKHGQRRDGDLLHEPAQVEPVSVKPKRRGEESVFEKNGRYLIGPL